MSILRLWVVGAAFVAALLVLAGWFLGAQPRLAEAGAANAERQGVESANQQYEAILVQLRELSANLPELESELAALSIEVPSTPELSTLLGQLNVLAGQSGVSLTEVTAEPPVLVDPAVLANYDVSDLVGIPVTITAVGGRDQITEFIRAVQFGPRLMWVGRFASGDDSDFGEVTLDGYIFVLPEEGAALPAVDEAAVEGEAPAVDPSAPTTDPSAEPSTSPSP